MTDIDKLIAELRSVARMYPHGPTRYRRAADALEAQQAKITEALVYLDEHYVIADRERGPLRRILSAPTEPTEKENEHG